MPASPEPTPSISTTTPQIDFLKLTLLVMLVYGVMAVFYNLPDLYSPWQNRELLVWPVTGLLLWSYWQGAKSVANPNTISVRWVVISGVMLALTAVLVPAFHSTDMFGYVNRGWQQAHYHLNPYVYTVADIPHWETDPMITNHWVNNPSPYGFLYLLIAKGLCLLGNGHREFTLALFKLGNLIMHLCTAGVIWLGAKRLNENPHSPYAGKINPALSLYLYLWNPLILVNTLANGHNDIYMGFFVVLSALFAITGAWLWILPSLMAATLIKYGAVVIVPVALLFLVRQRAWKTLGWGLVISLLIFGTTGWPYLPDWQAFHLKEINRNAFVSHGSLHSVVFNAFKTLSKEVIPAWHPYRDLVRAQLKNLLLITYGLFFAGLLWRRARQSLYAPTQLVRDALLVMAVLVCFISLKFYPWYLVMFFPLGLLLPEQDALRRWLLVLSGAQLVSITFIGQAHLLNFIVMTGLPTLWIFRQLKREARPATPETE